MDIEHLTRRTAVAGMCAAAVAGVTACSRYGGPTAPPPTPEAPATTAPGASQPGGSATEAAPPGLASTDDIPVGGGKVFKDQQVVITQPSAGEFKGFSAVCTHQGCVVDNVTDGTINCLCHGSKYQLDGSVAQGPAPQPLGAKNVQVSGDQISVE